MATSKKSTTASTYSKEQLLAAERYSRQRDVLAVVLDDKKRYTTAQADELVTKFMERKVK